MKEPSAAQLGHLVQVLSRAETADDVARVIAEEGAVATGAELASIAVLDAGPSAAPAQLYHAPGLIEDVAERYPAIPADDSTPMGTVLRSGGEIWLPSLSDTTIRYPSLLEDTVAAGLSATAYVALLDQHQRVIGAMGVFWAQAQAFADAQKEAVRVVARLAAEALGRAQQLEAERAARQRTERLQKMMSALVASASLAEVTAAVFEHGLLPFGASAARLVLVDQQQPDRLVTVNAVGMPEPALTEWRAFPLSAPSPSRMALATSAIVYVPTREELTTEFPEARLAHTSPGQRAWAAVPLLSSGRTLGVLTLVFDRPRPLDEGPDQIALAALASAVADAISRATRHDSDRDLVMSVQRSLLSSRLPEIPGVRLGAYYRPAETHYGIGGDWYDAVPLPRGRIMLIVGDVAGHGLEAAITMGQVRSAARALAPAYEPAPLLAALDQFVCDTIKEPLVTASVVIIDPTHGTLRYCLAGHPPPLLRRPEGSVRTLSEANGMVLGLETRSRPEQVISYAPGSCLVLFTDGLVERRDKTVDAGIDRIAAALEAAPPADPASLCDALVRQSIPGEANDDDTALLCAFLT
jgi:GAF domain-containing protein